MSRALAGWIAACSILALAIPAPAAADIRLQRKVEKPPRKAPAPRRPVTRPKPPEPEPEEQPRPVGINPELMREAIVEANYRATLETSPTAGTATLGATDGKTGWSVNFANCIGANFCGEMSFYTLWNVSNEANVCSVWGTDIVKDPSRTLGKPYCYTVPDLPRQFHLKLSSTQLPYAGIERLEPAQAKERMTQMIRVWTEHLPMLSQAWNTARTKCPRPGDKCS